MAEKQLNAQGLSGRQLSVAVVTAGLSPAAALAGTADWFWVLVWTGAGVLLAWLVLRWWGDRSAYQGAGGRLLYVLYAGWSAVLAARVLDRAVRRLELTSGGSPRLWLLLLLAVPLLWIGWGKAAPFFRMVEILWLAMAAALALVLLFGLTRGEWRYVWTSQADWQASALAVGEIFAPALFVLPYIYKVSGRSNRRALGWLSGLGAAAAGLSLVTVGILGAAAKAAPYGFYAAAGTLGKSARCEGLLSVLWLLPDLTLVSLLCRAWGAQRRPLIGAALASGLAAVGIGAWISGEIAAAGTLILLAAVRLLPRGEGKIVVKF